MTKEEAINIIRQYECCNEHIEACEMAIEALHREEAEEKGYCHRIRPKNVEVVVRCKECVDYVQFAYWFDDEGKKRDCHYCTFHSMEVHGNDFCSWAKMKGHEE